MLQTSGGVVVETPRTESSARVEESGSGKAGVKGGKIGAGGAEAEVFYHPAVAISEFGYGVGVSVSCVAERGGDTKRETRTLLGGKALECGGSLGGDPVSVKFEAGGR